MALGALLVDASVFALSGCLWVLVMMVHDEVLDWGAAQKLYRTKSYLKSQVAQNKKPL